MKELSEYTAGELEAELERRRARSAEQLPVNMEMKLGEFFELVGVDHVLFLRALKQLGHLKVFENAALAWGHELAEQQHADYKRRMGKVVM